MTLPRILVVHNRYQAAGGEDSVVDDEVALLRERGHAVETYLRDNRELEHLGALDAFGQALWARRSARELEALLAAFRPDVVHVHNTFARVSASVYWPAARASVPVVQTLHNFRLMCVQAMLLREGSEGLNCFFYLHICIIDELCNYCKHISSGVMAAVSHRSACARRE